MRDSTGSPQKTEKDLVDDSKTRDYNEAGQNDYLHDVPDAQRLNMASILKGSAANRMNLFEKKAALINA
jgi:hypothetical protein